MSENWTAIAKEVDEALASVGATAHIIRAGTPKGPAYNQTPGTPAMYPVTVVYGKWSANQIDGTLIRTDDQKVTVSAVGFVPQVGDRFWTGEWLNGERLTKEIVPPLNKIAPAGEAVMYTLNVRG